MQQQNLLKNASFLFAEDLIKSLSGAGISSVEELMVVEVADILSKSNGSLTAEAVEDARSKAADFFGGFSTNALSLSLTELTGPQFHASGQSDFDALLGGGLPKMKIVELIGGIGVGKSQLCMWLACRLVAQEPAAQVLFISSSNAVSAERLISLLDFVAPALRDEHLSRIRVHNCFDANQLLETMYALHDEQAEMSRGARPMGNPIACIMIDSIAPLIQHGLGKAQFGHSIMYSFRHVLLKTAALHGSAIVLSNFLGQQFNDNNNEVTWAMGPSWGQVPSLRIWMTPGEEGSDSCILTVSCSGAGWFQKACTMYIGSKGLRFVPHMNTN